MPNRFTHHAAIDWSGASGQRQKGIAVAIIGRRDTTPTLVRPGHIWSRDEVLDWVVNHTPPETLIGFDLGQSLPFADCGAFFPGWTQSPEPRATCGLWWMNCAPTIPIWVSPALSTTLTPAAISAAEIAPATCSIRAAGGCA
jgi:hypothetical protein